MVAYHSLVLRSKPMARIIKPNGLKRTPVRRTGDSILIVCEGGVTEPEYFRKLKRAWKLHAVEIVGDCGNAPISVVDKAKELEKIRRQEAGKRDSEHVPYDQVWCVFDRDQHESFDRALDKARGNRFFLAESIPCFEFWFLVHFAPKQHCYHDHDHVVGDLSQPRFLPGYVKKSVPFEELFPRTETAIENSQTVRNILISNPALGISYTKVDMLVKELKTLK